MVEFWSTMMLDTRGFAGNVYGTHMKLEGRRAGALRALDDAVVSPYRARFQGNGPAAAARNRGDDRTRSLFSASSVPRHDSLPTSRAACASSGLIGERTGLPDYPAGSEPPALLAPMLVALLLLIAFIALAGQLTRGFGSGPSNRCDAMTPPLGVCAPPALLASPQGTHADALGRAGTARYFWSISSTPDVLPSAARSAPRYLRMQAALPALRCAGARFDWCRSPSTPSTTRRPRYRPMRRNTDRMPGCGSSPARSIRRSGTGQAARAGVVAVPDGFGGFVHNGAIHLIYGRHAARDIRPR